MSFFSLSFLQRQQTHEHSFNGTSQYGHILFIVIIHLMVMPLTNKPKEETRNTNFTIVSYCQIQSSIIKSSFGSASCSVIRCAIASSISPLISLPQSRHRLLPRSIVNESPLQIYHMTHILLLRFYHGKN